MQDLGVSRPIKLSYAADQFGLINHRIQQHRHDLEARGFTVSWGADPARFGELREGFEGYVHPSLDPNAGARPRCGEFMWISVHAARRPVAVIAARLFHGRLEDMLHMRRLWGREAPTLADLAPFPARSLSIVRRIRGRISMQGGMFVDPSARGMGISTNLMWLVRLAGLRHWGEDWQIGLLTEETHEKNIHIPKYGYEVSTVLFADGAVSEGPRPDHSSEYLVYCSSEFAWDSLATSSGIESS